MLFIQYPKCTTCQKAKKWLEDNNIAFTDRHIKEQNPTFDELKQWYQMSGLPLKRFFNTIILDTASFRQYDCKIFLLKIMIFKHILN